jgi:hypothetical protein
MSYIIVASAILVAAFVLTQLLFKTEQAMVQGIPEIPGWPIVGNLLQLGSDHAAVCMKWAEKYGPVFQVRYSPFDSSYQDLICLLGWGTRESSLRIPTRRLRNCGSIISLRSYRDLCCTRSTLWFRHLKASLSERLLGMRVASKDERQQRPL